jgi:hypothetical protein
VTRRKRRRRKVQLKRLYSADRYWKMYIRIWKRDDRGIFAVTILENDWTEWNNVNLRQDNL